MPTRPSPAPPAAAPAPPGARPAPVPSTVASTAGAPVTEPPGFAPIAATAGTPFLPGRLGGRVAVRPCGGVVPPSATGRPGPASVASAVPVLLTAVRAARTHRTVRPTSQTGAPEPAGRVETPGAREASAR